MSTIIAALISTVSTAISSAFTTAIGATVAQASRNTDYPTIIATYFPSFLSAIQAANIATIL